MMSAQPDAGELLDASLPHLVPERVVEVASTQAGCPVAAYVLDVDGSCALRLAGDVERFPERIPAPVGVGPEIIPEALPQLRALVIDRVGPSTLWPMVVRDRVIGFLLARDRPAVDLEAFAGQAASALELASGYTDALHAVRRRKDTQPAAEIQQNLLPPRLARVDRADVAGGVLPGYDVGGDFFDYAGNADGLWLVVADATGKGNSAAALSSLAIGALRAARRAGAGLQEAARLADEAIMALDMQLYLTAVLGSWDPNAYRLRWINCGHPTPLILRADGHVEELDGERTYPLGIRFAQRVFPVLSAQVGPADRLLLYSDGVSERRTADGGRIGEDGLRAILAELGPCSAATTVRGLQDAVINASPEALRDDATLMVIAPHG
jgi:serine phosphatase RsbU (regulator of sigma subunit)